MTDHSKKSLVQFLEMIVKKGWVNTNTGNSWKAAVNKVLVDVAGEKDVREIDLKTELLRYNNLHPGALAPDSLRVYEQRANLAIDQFLQYKNDPTTYKPPSRGSSTFKAEKKDGNGQTKRSALRGAETTGNSVQEVHRKSDPEPVHGRQVAGTATELNLALPFPLRPNYLAQIVIPRDMTKEEADRLCTFIQALAHAK